MILTDTHVTTVPVLVSSKPVFSSKATSVVARRCGLDLGNQRTLQPQRDAGTPTSQWNIGPSQTGILTLYILLNIALSMVVSLYVGGKSHISNGCTMCLLRSPVQNGGLLGRKGHSPVPEQPVSRPNKITHLRSRHHPKKQHEERAFTPPGCLSF